MSKSFRLFFSAAIIIVICFIRFGVSKPLMAWGLEKSDEQNIIDVINSYFLLRYDTFKNNEPLFFSSSIDDHNETTIAWLKQEADKREIEMRIHTAYNLKVSKTSYNLNFERIIVDQYNATVTLSESNEIVYQNNLNYPSAMANLKHEISLARTEQGWKIINDVYTDDLIRLLKTMSKEEILKNIQTNLDQNILDNIHQEQDYPILEYPTIDSGWRLYNYDNMDVAAYADTNYNQAGPIPSTIREMTGWDPSWPTNHKVYTSDCTNFLSQAVFEGVSYTASDPNYFYPNPNNYSSWWYYKFSATTDGSSPWVNVGEFYNFLTANFFNYITWGIGIRGPAGYGVDLCNIEVGDLIFLKSQNVWQHTVIVDQIGSNPCNTNDVYVAAHSDNYKRRPLAEYSGYVMYPVEIKGYLDDSHQTFLSLVTNSWEASGFEAQSLYPAPEDTYPADPSPKPYPEP